MSDLKSTYFRRQMEQQNNVLFFYIKNISYISRLEFLGSCGPFRGWNFKTSEPLLIFQQVQVLKSSVLQLYSKRESQLHLQPVRSKSLTLSQRTVQLVDEFTVICR